MHNRSHDRADESATAEVIDLVGRKRDRLSKKFGGVHPALRDPETQPTPATVTPIETSRRWRGSPGD